MAWKLLQFLGKKISRERKRGMRNSFIVGLLFFLMACSSIVQHHKGTTDDELTVKPTAFLGETPPDLEEIFSMATDEMAESPQVTDLSPQDQTPEEGEGRELIVGIPGPSLGDEVRAFSEPNLPPTEQGLFWGEREFQWPFDFPGEDGDNPFLEAETYFQDQAPSQEEEVAREPAFDIPIIINGKVEQFIKYYQTRGRKVFTRWLARSRRYIPLMKMLLREKGLPEDLVYLALIESGYNPLAYSRRKAMGLWQFRYHTGKRYGLKVDWWIDERRDPVKSTIAAARYLKHLYDRFECWYLAAAGYNAGEGKILRAIKRYKTEDFWELTKYPYLKRETKNFIPKMIAAALVAKNPEDYGFSDISYEEPIRFETVKVRDATDLRVIAKASESTYKELKRLNPELRRWCTPPHYPDYELKLPYGKKEIFLRNFSKIPPSKRITFRRHVVRSGETLSHITLRYRTNIGAIMRMNHIRNLHSIRAGRSLIIPVRGSDKFERGKMAERLHQGRDLFDYKGRAFIYTVREGDTLWDISRSAGIDVESLCRWNGIQNASRIYPGDRLKIPSDDTSTPLGTEGKNPPARNPEG
jgi:membrane-bound lytic murein transglycosylase D